MKGIFYFIKKKRFKCLTRVELDRKQQKQDPNLGRNCSFELIWIGILQWLWSDLIAEHLFSLSKAWQAPFQTLSSSDRSLNCNPLMSRCILPWLPLSSGTKQYSAAIQAHKLLFCNEEGCRCQLNKLLTQSNVPVEKPWHKPDAVMC